MTSSSDWKIIASRWDSASHEHARAIIDDLERMEKLAIGGNGTTHFYYMDAWEDLKKAYLALDLEMERKFSEHNRWAVALAEARDAWVDECEVHKSYEKTNLERAIKAETRVEELEKELALLKVAGDIKTEEWEKAISRYEHSEAALAEIKKDAL